MGAAFGRFPRTSRLLARCDYQRVFERPVRSADSCFTVLARHNGSGRPRLGLGISKKHIRRAVDRNRVKRLIRESFRLHRQDLPGLDIVVLGRQGLHQRTNRQIRDSLMRHWARLIQQCASS